MDVISAALIEAGCDVAFKGRNRRRPTNRLQSRIMSAQVLAMQQWSRLASRPLFDANFFIETIFADHLPLARTNWLFANPEWFRESNEAHVSKLDGILCKTPSASSLLGALGVPRRQIGFTSPDRRIAGYSHRGELRCLHVSGASALKGSEAVIEAWSRHPEWPQLVMVRRATRYGGEEAPPLPDLPNVRYETEFLADKDLRSLQNACEVHVLPSQAEGYGHVINEGLSCGAVVVTTDAPPMNELVTPDRGALVRVNRSEGIRRGVRHFVEIDDLERQLMNVFAMSAAERSAIGHNARCFYESQRRAFRENLQGLVGEIVNGT